GSISLTVPSEDYSISQLDLYLNGEFFKSYFNIGYASVSIDNLFPGKYTCIIHYDKTFKCIFKFKFEIGYYTDWSILEGLQVKSNSINTLELISIPLPEENGYYGGAISKNVLSPYSNGWI